MTDTRSEYNSTLKGFRNFALHPPPQRLWPELERFIHDFLRQEPDGVEVTEERAAWLASRSEAALRLHVLARSAGPEGPLDLCLDGLGRMGEFGRILFLDLVRRGVADGEAVAGQLARAPVADRVLLCNRALLDPDESPTEPAALALDTLGLLKDESPGEWSRAAGRIGPGNLSFAASHALASGVLGRRLRDLLEAEHPGRETVEAASLLPLLEGAGDALAALASAPDAEPEVAIPLLRALADTRPGPSRAAAEHVRPLLEHGRDDVALAALETLALTRADGAGGLAAGLLRRRPGLRAGVLARLPLLPHGQFLSCLESLPPRDRMLAWLSSFLALVRADGEVMAGLLDEEGERYDPRVVDALRRTLVVRSSRRPREAEWVGERGTEEPRRVEVGQAELLRWSAEGSLVADSRFRETGLDRADFRRALVERTVFEGCVFTRCDFSGAVFRDAVFRDCSFEGCDFRSTRFLRVEIERCRMGGCLLRHVEAHGLRAVELDAACCLLDGLRLTDSEARSCRLRASEVRRSSLSGLRGLGLELLDCHLEGVDISASSLRGAILSACTWTACRAWNLDAAGPPLFDLEETRLVADLRRAAGEKPRLPDSLNRATLDLAEGCVRAWLHRRETRSMSTPFERDAVRRLAMAKRRLPPGARDFLELTPLLLHSRFFDRHSGLHPAAPPCRVRGYHPTLSTLETAARHFAGAGQPVDAPEGVVIEGLYTIGSLGTVAQSGKSDIDFWLCCRLENLSEADAAGLRRKCELLEEWASERFGLEAHLFLMDTASVRENNFGASSGESSGTAQALMLKEEFYRTALRLAGARPAWWLVPPGACQKTYDRAVERLPRGFGDRFIDLGHVPGIPQREFFGAALWQIVKALKHPFKSVMKFALLEKYTEEPSGTLLCDAVKANIQNGSLELWRIDPYALLFMKVAAFYDRRSNRAALDLIRTAFLLKANIRGEASRAGIPARRDELSARRFLALETGCGRLGGQPARMDEDGGLPRLIEVGRGVNSFIVQTYLRVRKRWLQSGEAAIHPNDLTKLGRRIFAAFAPREHKVGRLFITGLDGRGPDQLAFSANRPAAPSAYLLHCGQRDPRTRRLEPLELKRAGDLAWLAAWAVANGLYTENVDVRADYTVSPVIARDLADLMARLCEFFPLAETFDTDIDEGLNPERVVRAMLVLNLLEPREATRIRSISIIHSTNWGEMFCKTVGVDDDTPRLSPMLFLAGSVAQHLPSPPALAVFRPRHAACPDIVRGGLDSTAGRE